MLQVYLNDAVDIVAKSGKEAINAFAEGDEQKMMLLGLKRFTKTEPFNSKDARRLVAATAIRQKLVDYMKIADDKKVKAIYTMVEDEINTSANNWDKDFIKEHERRSKSFANGTAKTYSWEETKQAAIQKVKSARK